MFQKIKFLLVITMALASFLAVNNFALADGIQVSPPKIEPLIVPGQIYEGSIKVTNESTAAKTLYPYVRDFSAEGEDGSARLIEPGSTVEGIGGWIKISPQGIDFAANESKSISFKIDVPADASPGGHYGALVFGNRAADIKLNTEDKGAAISTSQQVACLILVQIAGEMDINALIREFKTDKSFYGSPYKINFFSRIENLGNVHVKPRGEIKITDMFNKSVATISVNNPNANVLPKTIRKFTNEWEGKKGFGRYKATLALSYGIPADQGGTGMQSAFAEQTFWIIPWRTIIPIVLIAIFVICLLIIWLRFYKNVAIKKAMQQMGAGRARYVRNATGPSPAVHFSLIIATIFVIIFLIGLAMYFIFFA